MFEGQNENYSNHYWSSNRQSSNYVQQSSLQHISAFNFTGNSLLQVSLVYQKKEANYHSDFFFFITLVPAGKNGKDKTYIMDKKVSYKFEYAKVMELAYALRAHATGNGGHFGNHVFFVDTSKAANVGENTEVRKGKRLSLTTSPNKKQNAHNNQYTNKPTLINSIVINLIADRGTSSSGEKDNSISYTMNIYEAQTLADNLLYIAHKARDLHMGQMMKDNRKSFRSKTQ